MSRCSVASCNWLCSGLPQTNTYRTALYSRGWGCQVCGVGWWRCEVRVVRGPGNSNCGDNTHAVDTQVQLMIRHTSHDVLLAPGGTQGGPAPASGSTAEQHRRKVRRSLTYSLELLQIVLTCATCVSRYNETQRMYHESNQKFTDLIVEVRGCSRAWCVTQVVMLLSHVMLHHAGQRGHGIHRAETRDHCGGHKGIC